MEPKEKISKGEAERIKSKERIVEANKEMKHNEQKFDDEHSKLLESSLKVEKLITSNDE